LSLAAGDWREDVLTVNRGSSRSNVRALRVEFVNDLFCVIGNAKIEGVRDGSTKWIISLSPHFGQTYSGWLMSYRWRPAQFGSTKVFSYIFRWQFGHVVGASRMQSVTFGLTG
jgi:hypothetical protein